MLPGLLSAERRDRGQPGGTAPAAETDTGRQLTMLERSVVRAVPSEVYTHATRSAAGARSADAAGRSVMLAAMAAALHGLAFFVFARVLSSPGPVGGARRSARGTSSRWRVPGASPGTSAVAINQLRLALRTPRGRSTILSPVLVFAMFAVMMWRGQGGMEFGPIKLQSGVGLASFAGFVSLMSILPLAMNQFAIDRAGLTLALLSPLETVSLLRGKAIGNGLIAAIPVALCLAGAGLLFPAGAFTGWVSVPLALLATYVLAAPVAAMLSAAFPRAVDLNSIGRGSNAHGAAGLLGMLSFVAAGAPAALIVLLAAKLLDRPALAPVALAVWTAICLASSAWLFRVAVNVFERRKENLGLTSRGTPG
jgi:hypothetical protein